MRFAYWGRLEFEKGFDLVIRAAAEMATKHLFLIFGAGGLEETLLNSDYQTNDLSKLPDGELLKFKFESTGVYYLGFRDFEKVMAPMIQGTVDAALMPSRFLESFGLSALEASRLMIPCIAPRKGGLERLIFPQYELKQLTVENLIQAIGSFEKPSQLVLDFMKTNTDHFSERIFWHQLQTILPKGTKRILLVNDYGEKIGGAEKHVYQLAELFKKHQIKVDFFFGKPIGKSTYWDFVSQILSGLFRWIAKPESTLKKKIVDFKPDLIWCHSISRVIGDNNLAVITDSQIPKFISHHDFSLYSFFPSLIEDESQLCPDLDFFKMIQKSGNLGFGKKMAALLKYIFVIRPIRKKISHFDQQIVYSDFMYRLISSANSESLTQLNMF